MSVTSIELARMCNVSRATVDRVFNNRGKVNETTRNKIIETAKAVGYHPNYLAQSLVTGRTFSIGLVAPSFHNDFFSILMNAISRESRRLNYITLVSLYEDNPDFEPECIRNLIERKVDGILLFTTSKSERTAEILREHKVPVVLLLNELEDFPCVNIDFYQAMLDATNYVISKEYKHLIFFGPPLANEEKMNIFAVKRKLDGFLRALELHRDENIRYTIMGSHEDTDRIQTLRVSRDEKTAILCTSDIYALKIMKSLKTRGLHIPSDVGIMGFDGIEMLDYQEPSVATVEVPIARMGETAVRSLIDLITENSNNEERKLSYKIRPGQSIV